MRAGVAAVTADHGEVLGRHDIWWRHKDLYPDTLHVPLILAWPGAPAGARVAAPVELLDLGRTLLDRVGLTDVRFPGRDLGELAEGAATASRPRFSIATGWRSAAVSVDGWHLILHLRDSHRVELFERATDRYCERDLADTEVERARALRALLVEWLGDAGEGWTGVQGADPAMLERLAELGYSDQLEPGGPGGAGAPDPDCACDWCGRFGPRR